MEGRLEKFRRACSLYRRSGFFGLIEAMLSSTIHGFERVAGAGKVDKGKFFKVSEFINFLKSAGVSEGDSIFLHSSWDSIRESDTTPMKLIQDLRDLVGADGTLAMPAYTTTAVQDGEYPFDLDRDPTQAGLIAEALRRMEGVKRSCNPLYSVCALGPHAEFLLDNQSKSHSAWDEFSPYMRIAAIKGSWIIGVGVGPAVKVATSQHVVESILIDHPYFKKLFRSSFRFRYNSKAGGEGHGKVRISTSVNHSLKLRRGYSKLYREAVFGDVVVYAIKANDLIQSTLEMALRGHTMYIWPIPWPWLFWSSRKLEANSLLEKALDKVLKSDL